MNFLTAAWDLRYIIAGTAIAAWIGIRLANNAVDDYIDRHINNALNAEPEAEWNAWVDQALRMSETPIHDQLARQQFEAEALAEIDEMTGGIA